MSIRLPPLVRTTTFKLALLHSILFTVFVLGLLVYLYASTVVYVRAEASASLDAELTELTQAYSQGGLVRLNRSVRERQFVPGSRQFLYLLQDAQGQKIGGGLSVLPEGIPLDGRQKYLFDVEYQRPDGEIVARPAEGRAVVLPDGGIILVAFDVGEFQRIVPRITRVVWTAAPIGLLMSLIGGIVISRSAARRADTLAKTAEGVMAGDLSRRVPVIGSGDEFDRLGQQLNAMLGRIETLMASSRHVGDSIAHDLRSPLTRLRNRLETALAEPMSHEVAEETLGQTLGEVDSVLGTFNAILRLSRLEAGQGGRMVRTDISALAAELAELYEPACEEAGLEFSADIGRGLFVLGEKDLIAQALSNLLDNAVKYTPEGGKITFNASRGKDSKVVLEVRDTGPGIPEGDRERVVKRFVRLEASRSEPGSGLGLALVDAVAHVHNGEFSLGSGEGKAPAPVGLSARLLLPKA
ncbi:MAG: HAMP domain-containing sensor histidine kinase [Hyphomonadaceae bacterium]